jgi:hypothetical protein
MFGVECYRFVTVGIAAFGAAAALILGACATAQAHPPEAGKLKSTAARHYSLPATAR